jgi:hypothetical protein
VFGYGDVLGDLKDRPLAGALAQGGVFGRDSGYGGVKELTALFEVPHDLSTALG